MKAAVALALPAIAMAFASAPVSASVTPDTIPGLTIWLDATDIYADGTEPGGVTRVTTWTDKANGLVFTHKMDAPSLVPGALNGKAVVHFEHSVNGGNGEIMPNGAEYLECVSPILQSLQDNPNTMFVVARATHGGHDNGGNIAGYVIARPGYHSGLSFRGVGTANEVRYERWLAGRQGEVLVDLPYSQGTYSIFTGVIDGSTQTTPSSISFSIDGGASGSQENGSLPLWDHNEKLTDDINPAQLLRIGTGYYTEHSWGTCGLDGDIAEIIFFNRVLTDAEQDQIRAYLAARWGLSQFRVSNPVNGSTEFIAGGKVSIDSLPGAGSFGEVQFSLSGDETDLAPDGWIPLAGGAPSTFSFTPPASTGEITIHAWLRADSSSTEFTHYATPITYVAEAPVAAIKQNLSLALPPGGRTLHAAEFDAGCVAPGCGIASIEVAPARVNEEGETTVTLTVTDLAGQTASVGAAVAFTAATDDPFALLPVTDGLKLRLVADDCSGVGDGGAVGSWGDASGNGRNAAQGDPARQPRFVAGAVNGHGVIRFDGEDDCMMAGDLELPQNFTIFAVAKGSNYQSLLRWQTGGACFVYPWGKYPASSAPTYNLLNNRNGGNWNRENAAPYTGFINDAWNLASARVACGVEHGVRLCNNGREIDTATWDSGVGSGSYMHIGCYYGGGDLAYGETISGTPLEFMDADVAEVVVYDRLLDDSEHFAVASYLQHKYGLQDGPTAFAVSNPITGSKAYTCTNELDVTAFPSAPDGAEYQATASDDPAALDPAAWLAADFALPPATISFPAPESDGPFTLTLWTRSWRDGACVTNSYRQAMTYDRTPPSPAVADIAVNQYGDEPAHVPPAMVDNGSSDSESGIFGIVPSPAYLASSGDVMVTIINEAGLSTTAVARVTLVPATDIYISGTGSDDDGDGSASHPFRTLTHAVGLASPIAGKIHIDEGYYAPSTGESFPLYPAAGVDITAWSASGSELNRSARILDGETDGSESSTSTILSFPDATGSNIVSGICIRNSWSAPVHVPGGRLLMKDCIVTQSGSWRDLPSGPAAENNGHIVLEDCEFTGASGRHCVIALWAVDAFDDISLDIRNCVFHDNTTRWGTIANIDCGHGAAPVAVRVSDTLFERCGVYDFGWHNEGGGGYSGSVFFGQGNASQAATVQFDRCRFLCNSNAPCLFFFGGLVDSTFTDTPTCYVRDSLFAGNKTRIGDGDPGCITIGNAAHFSYDNCTFVGNSGGFTGWNALGTVRNSILFGESTINPGSDVQTHVRLHDTIVWDTPEGCGYDTENSSNVIYGDPLLVNVTVPGDDPAFDAHLREGSPALDRGDNAIIDADELDLDLTARIKGAYSGRGIHVDLGCYELYVRPRGTIFLLN